MPSAATANDAVNGDGPGPGPGASIDVRSLTYSFPDGSTGLEDVCVSLPAGSRTILIGGASLILQIPPLCNCAATSNCQGLTDLWD